MTGAPLSRWTMAYFAAALAFLLAGLALMACGFGFPAAAVEAPDTLVVVHLIAVGWLGLLFCGALLQFVPVLTASEARLPYLAAPALLAIIGGLLVLIVGFLALGGRDLAPSILLPGACLLLAGLAALALSLLLTIHAAARPGLSAILVMLGLAGLTTTALLGTGFAAALSGLFDCPALDGLLPAAIPFHGAFGLLGWMTLTAIGVSYRLFAMFMLAPETTTTDRRFILSASAAMLGGLGALAAALIDSGSGAAWGTSLLAVGLACLVAGLYLRDIVSMFRARRRRQLELNSRASLAALAFLVAGLALLATGQLLETSRPVTPAAFYVLAMGWLSGLGLAQLYKIVPFLTWLEGYGPVMGRAAVPRVQDLVREKAGHTWFVLYFVSVALATALMLADMPAGFRLAALLQFIAVAGLCLEYMRARRLSYVPEALRLPAGMQRPRLIYAAYR